MFKLTKTRYKLEVIFRIYYRIIVKPDNDWFERFDNESVIDSKYHL